MRSMISRWNRRRLFKREESKKNAAAREREMLFSKDDRVEILQLLKKFQPMDCGKELVRVGPERDGGYLLPDDFDGLAALYSPGVDETIGFDLDISRRDIPCFLADGTVEPPSCLASNMQFEQMMIGDGPVENFMTMADWIARTAPAEGDLMLQMDIEGAEYEVLPSTPRPILDRFRIIAIELHTIDDCLLDPNRRKLSDFLELLTQNHVICHLHPNTITAPVQILGRSVPPLLELTLLRKDRLARIPDKQAAYPHPLDKPNSNQYPLREFPPFW
ncbi:hypothetical protein [Ruegeria sp. HKCCD8929]|uniref:hypothetical protein n=1 Tax=Ruegeria sp. HKCCD8929 TaxID=2683006 RepID=UPI001488BEE0|nr:hypothetical protein [Ruegeria sp. HKCCD8929]